MKKSMKGAAVALGAAALIAGSTTGAMAATDPITTPRTATAAPVLSRVALQRQKIAALGRQQVGDTYRAGNSGPDAFDCSGLTRYVFKQVTGRELPHYSVAQFRIAKRVSLRNALPGDLVFYLRGGAHHVGLYLGHGTMVHAIGVGQGVKIHSIFGSWYSSHFTGLGRILPA